MQYLSESWSWVVENGISYDFTPSSNTDMSKFSAWGGWSRGETELPNLISTNFKQTQELVEATDFRHDTNYPGRQLVNL